MSSHYNTSYRSKMQKAYQFLIAENISFNSRDIFKEFNIFERANYKMIKKDVFACRNHY
jgi:hypothetical protein